MASSGWPRARPSWPTASASSSSAIAAISSPGPTCSTARIALRTDRGDVAVVFRDHHLSDLIGFTYQKLGGEQAAEDMIVRLKHIHHALRHQERPGLVSIILDGENAWEYYEHNGDVFLQALYDRLQRDPDLAAVTISEHLDEFPATDELPELASGSWIRGDFTTWIGDPEHTEAWRRLGELRQRFETWLATDPPPAQVTEARRFLFAAEGSDWFWWYSPRNRSDQDALFDHAFQEYLAAAYRAMGQTPPPDLTTPIQGRNEQEQRPAVPFTPQLTAEPDPTAQWRLAQVLRPAASSGAMQQAGEQIQAVRYGNDSANLYLRVELAGPVAKHQVEALFLTQEGAFSLRLGKGQTTAFLYRRVEGVDVSLGPVHNVTAGALLECAVPLASLGLTPLTPGASLGLVVKLDEEGDRGGHSCQLSQSWQLSLP